MCPDCLLVRQDLHEIRVLFCSWYVVFLQYLLSTFSEKEHSAAIYFPPLFQCKTGFCTRIAYRNDKTKPREFFSQPYAVSNVQTCMEKVARDILNVPCF